ncbi:MAG: sigma-70 family RNA polymerase sigma factor [Actinomycetota bacterium]
MAVSYEDKQVSVDLGLDEPEAFSGWTFDELYRSFKDELVDYARQRDADDPDGIADLALFDGYRALDRLKGRSTTAIRAYLIRAVRGHISTERRASVDVSLTDTICEADDAPSESFEAELTQGLLLEELIDSLPESQQAVLNHRFRQGLNGAEIAEALNKKPNAVYQLQFRALNNLRLLLVAATFAVALAFVALWTLRPQGQDLIDVSPVDGPAPTVPGPAEIDPDGAGDDEQSAGVITEVSTPTTAPLVRTDAAPLIEMAPAADDTEATDSAPEVGDEPDEPAGEPAEGVVATSDRPMADEAPTPTTTSTSTTVAESTTSTEPDPVSEPEGQASTTTTTQVEEFAEATTPPAVQERNAAVVAPPARCEVQPDWGADSGVEVHTLTEDHTSEYIFFTVTQSKLTRTSWLEESPTDRVVRDGHHEREWRAIENLGFDVSRVYFVATVDGDGHSELVRCGRA